MKYEDFPVNVPWNQSIDNWIHPDFTPGNQPQPWWLWPVKVDDSPVPNGGCS